MSILYAAPGSAVVRKPRILLQGKNIRFIFQPVNPILIGKRIVYLTLKKLLKIETFNYLHGDRNRLLSDRDYISEINESVEKRKAILLSLKREKEPNDDMRTKKLSLTQ
jgi:hypothetical protein